MPQSEIVLAAIRHKNIDNFLSKKRVRTFCIFWGGITWRAADDGEGGGGRRGGDDEGGGGREGRVEEDEPALFPRKKKGRKTNI